MLPAGTVAISSTTGEVITDSAARPVPIIEVAFKKDMWWSIPAVMSAQMYQKYLNGKMLDTRGIGAIHALAPGRQKKK